MNAIEIKFKKRLRLKSFCYRGRYRYFLTLHAFEENILANDEVVKELLRYLRETSDRYGFAIWSYCFMPDHLHLLVEGIQDDSDLRKFVSMFKQRSGFHFRRRFGRRLWQINYFEHVLRKEEVSEQVMRYILENPVRKGLVADYKDYPFSGFFMIPL